MIKGFCKDACSMLSRLDGTQSKKLKAFRKIIDGLIFVHPRKIELHLNGELSILEQPLRGQTAQGERVALVRSDSAPAGSWIEFTMTVLGSVPRKTIEEWLAYGAHRGLGQWRNGGYGAFEYQIKK